MRLPVCRIAVGREATHQCRKWNNQSLGTFFPNLPVYGGDIQFRNDEVIRSRSLIVVIEYQGR